MWNHYYPHVMFARQPAVNTSTGLSVSLLYRTPKPAQWGKGILPWQTMEVKQEVIQDVRTLSQIQRQPLGIGPTVDIYLHRSLLIQNLPKRAFMALSPVAQRLLTDNPDISGIVLYPEQVAPSPMIQIGQFVQLNITRLVPISLTTDMNAPLLSLIAFYKTAFLLGMEFYVQDIHNAICDQIIDNRSLDYKVLDEIDTLPPTARLHQAVTAIMQEKYQRGLIADEHALWEWLHGHPQFLEGMDDNVL